MTARLVSPSVSLLRRLSSVAVLGLMLSLTAPALRAQPLAEPSERPLLVTGLPDFTRLVEHASPAVVNIRTTETVSASGQAENPLNDFFRRFFPPGTPGLPQAPQTPPSEPSEPQPENQQRGVGSGFLISQDGYLLSNHHVVAGATDVFVTLVDKREFKATVVGSDERTDVALLKINAKNLPFLPLGNPSRLKAGEWVVAIGSPFGLENSVTAGIVSAIGRDTGDYLPFIQTDVAVNPGNSGGPLLNLRGEVVGINSQIYSRTGGFMGISFAIPIDEARRVSDQLRATGKVVRGRIGVAIDEVSREVAEALGLKTAEGALVRNVDPQGPAAKAGVEAGDIILSFNGQPIRRMSDLPRLVGNTKPGTEASLQVWRRGDQRRLAVTVVELEAKQAAAAPAPKPSPVASLDTWLGLKVRDLSAERLQELGVKGGAEVVDTSGAARAAGLRAGDVVLSVNNTQVLSAKALVEQTEKLDRKQNLVLLVRRGNGVAFVPIRPQ